MPIEITNSLRSTSIIRVEGVGTYYANISDLSANTAQETVTAVNIKKINWSAIYDGVDNLEAEGEAYCTTDVCLLPNA